MGKLGNLELLTNAQIDELLEKIATFDENGEPGSPTQFELDLIDLQVSR